MKYCFFIFFLSLVLFFNFDIISANNIFHDLEVYNIDSSDKYLAIEYKKNINGNSFHYILLYNMVTREITDIYNNDNFLINDNLYFPSLSKDSKYLVFTSRATNIVSDELLTCYDIYDGETKVCNSIYIYDIEYKTFSIVKSSSNMIDGDCYVAKISGNGKYIAFESISTNFLNPTNNCSDLNGISNCINVFKYDIMNETIQLISTNDTISGGNRNSVSPSIDYEGRFISYQTNSSNIIDISKEFNHCYNMYNNILEVCTNIYLFDSYNESTTIISKSDEYILNNHSMNPIISENGLFVVYETYATNLVEEFNYKKHIVIYDAIKNVNSLITIFDGILNNRDNYIQDISCDGKYVLYSTNSTNLDNLQNFKQLYVFNTSNSKVSVVKEKNANILFGIIKNDNVYFYDDSMNLFESSIDNQSPKILENQVIYILKDNLQNIIDKINITDNLSDRDTIEIYINMEGISKTGSYDVNIMAKDEFGNTSNAIVTVNVFEEDLEGPIFINVSKIKILKGSSELNLSNYITAEDKIDGNVRVFIIDDGGLNLNKTGSYILKLKATDNSYNSEYIEISVLVYDNYNFSHFYEIIIIFTILLGLIFLLIKVK